MTSLPLTLEKRYSVLLPPTAFIRILLVGVGGTGSWLALSLGRLAYHARQKGNTFRGMPGSGKEHHRSLESSPQSHQTVAYPTR